MSNSGNSHLPRGSLAGLEPMSFITLATPRLGVRGKKQTDHRRNCSVHSSSTPIAISE
ncbi:hypothetical protein YC2023_119519 [Brassica napus]